MFRQTSNGVCCASEMKLSEVQRNKRRSNISDLNNFRSIKIINIT
ncbi:MAG: hypothetical protein ACTS41_01230 [Candidatus Hodgkinia cicadicola]